MCALVAGCACIGVCAMSEQRRYWLLASALIILALSAIVYLVSHQKNSLKPAEDVVAAGRAVSSESRGGVGAGLNQDFSAEAGRSSDDLGDYVCVIRKELCLEDSLSAVTEVEARWLKQFGYPSHRRLQQLEGMALSELDALSMKGDLAARVVLGKKRIEVRDHSRGRNDIFNALLNGSTYAALEYARSNRPDVPGSSLAEARAYYRVAYLLGDWKAPREAYLSQQKYGGFDSWEMVRSDERAMELYRNILRYRGENHIPLRVWPRPQ